jgi:hypothetical protein
MRKLVLCIFFMLLLVPAVALGAPQNNALSNDVISTTPTIDENSIAGSKDPDIYTREKQQTKPIIDTNSIAGIKDPDLVPMTRGCCSHHRGVCDCDRGRTVCCDGTYSPTCGC